MQIKTVTFILAVLIAGLLNYETLACSCFIAGKVEDEIKKRDAVFVGTITEKEEIRVYENPNDSIYYLKLKYKVVIKTVYKGRLTNNVAYIFTGSGGGDCGYNFQIGKRYIIYGNIETDERYNGQVSIDENIAFQTTICTRTRKYQNKEIKEIEKFLKRRSFK